MSGTDDRDARGPAPRGPEQLRVLAWNLWELRGDIPTVLETLEDLAPDVLLMQEAPRLFLPGTRLRRFARQAGLEVLVGGFGGRGLAILAPQRTARRAVRRGMHPVRQQLTDLNSTYPRGVAAVRLAAPGGEVVLSSIHFALQEPNRIAHARHVEQLVRGAGCPVVAGGDLNETADGPARRLLEPVLTDPAAQTEWTFPAARPQRRIDAVLVSRGVRVHQACAVTATARVDRARLRTASDHLPTLLDISL